MPEPPLAMPKSCKCGPSEWRETGSVWPVCRRYHAMHGWAGAICGDCNHWEACHAKEDS